MAPRLAHLCMTQWEEDCLKWRNSVLTGKFAHWCSDWDGLPVDETTIEFEACTCYASKSALLEKPTKTSSGSP